MSKYNKTQMYFFKFPNTFFDTDEIEDISCDYDGDSTIILYLKLITLATNKLGYLCKMINGELKPYSVAELCKKTNTNEEDLMRRVKRLHEVGLIEQRDGMLYVEQALSFTNQTIGAEKKQKQRKNRADNCPPEKEERNNNLDDRNIDNRNSDNINNINNYNYKQQEGNTTHPALQDICYQVVSYLNEKAFKNFRPDSKKTVAAIKRRLSQGYKVEDFYTVIDNKVETWLSNGKLDKYLRPETLFGERFDEYLNEEPIRMETDWSDKYCDDY